MELIMNFVTIAAFLVAVVTIVEVRAGSCMKDVKNIKELDAALGKCKTTLGLQDEGKMNPEDIVKAGYDDKCVLKCVMTEMKYAKDDGTMDWKAVEDDLKKNGPEGKADVLLALMKDCADTTAKNAAISKDPCKSLAMTKVCFMMGAEKICS